MNILISSVIISFCAWLSEKRPDLAGFIISLPLSTLLVLALGQLQNGDPERGTLLAKSIFIAIPSTLVFFIPFLLVDKLKLSFWTAYVSGIVLLIAAFFIHRFFYSVLSR
ncbi:MAG: hypothetical protein ACXWQE_13080 [Bdellovibrionales bacterium]